MSVKQTKENPDLRISEKLECTLIYNALEQAGEKAPKGSRYDLEKLRTKLRVASATNQKLKDFTKIIQWEVEAIAQAEKIFQLIVEKYGDLALGQLVSQEEREKTMKPFSQEVFALLEKNDAYVNQTGYMFSVMAALIQDLEVRVGNIMRGATEDVNAILWGVDREYARCSDLKRILEENKEENKEGGE